MCNKKTYFILFPISLLIYLFIYFFLPKKRVELLLFFVAAQKGEEQIVEILLEKGANANLPAEVWFLKKY